MTTLFIFEVKSCENFKAIFLKTLFFKSSTSNAYISESFVLRRLGEVSIELKFYLVLGSDHDSILQKWDLFRWMYTYHSISTFNAYSWRTFQRYCVWLHIEKLVIMMCQKAAKIKIRKFLRGGRPFEPCSRGYDNF